MRIPLTNIQIGRQPATRQKSEVALVHPFRRFTSTEWQSVYGAGASAWQRTGEEWRSLLLLRDPMQSTLITAAIRIIAENIAAVEFKVAGPDDKLIENHPANAPFNMGDLTTRHELIWTIVEGLIIAGNAFLIPQPNRTLRALDWRNVQMPTSLSLNKYTVRNPFENTQAMYVPDAIAHLRYRRSVDGYNGIGLIQDAGLGELATDDVSQDYTLTILARLGVPGLIFMGKRLDNFDAVTDEDTDSIEQALDTVYSGAGRGAGMATKREWAIHEPAGVSNRGIDLSKVRQVVEERLLASIGVPPALISIGVGAQQVRVGRTMEELRTAFAVDTIQPLAEHIAGQLTKELLPFYPNTAGLRYLPDFAKSAMMQEHFAVTRFKQAEYLEKLVTAQILTPEEAKAQLPEF